MRRERLVQEKPPPTKGTVLRALLARAMGKARDARQRWSARQFGRPGGLGEFFLVGVPPPTSKP